MVEITAVLLLVVVGGSANVSWLLAVAVFELLRASFIARPTPPRLVASGVEEAAAGAASDGA